MTPIVFANVADATGSVAAGERVQEDFGFSEAEVGQAKVDRKRIAADYATLKLTRSFWRSEMLARLRFLSELKENDIL